MLLLTVGLFFLGTIFIIKGGDVFVDAAGWLSDVTGIPKSVIGATIVSFATTSPEYFVSFIATLKGFNDLSIGNAAGSLIANIGIAFSLLAFFTPGRIYDKLFVKKSSIMLISTATLWLFCCNGNVSVLEGIILLLIFILFTCLNIYSSGENKSKRVPTNNREIIFNTVKFVGGASAIIYGSNLIVNNGKTIATYLGVSEAVIGLTVVAVGTSLPEVVTSVTAIIKKESALSIGNIVGANILDATLILATGAFLSGGSLTVSPSTIWVDLPIALLLMLLAVLPSAMGKRLYRPQGIAIAVVYVTYLLYITVWNTV